jgi:hypothetical protein
MKPFSVKEIIETPIGQAICMTWRFEPGAYGVVELKRSEEIGALPGPKTKGGKRRAWPAGQGLEVHQITPERRQTTILPAHARARETGLGSKGMKPAAFRELLLSVLAVLGLLFLGSDLRAAPRQDADPDPVWTLVHGTTQQYGRLNLEKIAQLYLKGRKWRLAAAEGLDPAVLDGPVFAVGSLDDNIVAQALTLPVLTSGRQYLGRELEPGVGFVLAGRGELGQPFCVFTGLDDDAVF